MLCSIAINYGHTGLRSRGSSLCRSVIRNVCPGHVVASLQASCIEHHESKLLPATRDQLVKLPVLRKPSSNDSQHRKWGLSNSTQNVAPSERASRQGNSQALQELKEVGPPPYKVQGGFAVQHKWANLFEGADVFLAS